MSKPFRRAPRTHLHAWLLMLMLALARPSVAQLLGGGLDLGLGLSIDITGSVITTSSTYPSISLTSGGDLTVSSSTATCGDLEWNAGSINLQSGGELVLTSTSNAYPCASCSGPLAISGGSFTCQEGGSLVLQSGSQVSVQSCQVSNAALQLQDQAQLYLQACQVVAPMTCSGSAAAQVFVASGQTVCNANCAFRAPCQVQGGGVLQATDSGQIQVADNQELQIQGGGLSCSGMCGGGPNSNVVVGESASATLAFRGSAPSQCSAGVIQLQGQSQLIVAPEATKVVTSPTVITGTGTASLQGQTQCQSTYTLNHAQTQLSGSLAVSNTGKVVVSPGHTLVAQGGAQLVGAGAAYESKAVGCDSCGQPAELQIAPGPSPCLMSASSVGLKASGAVHTVANAHLVVQSQSEFHGAGSHIVESGGIHEEQDVHINNHANTVFHDQAQLVISGAGSHVCGAGHASNFEGATISHVNVQQQDTIHVQSGGSCHFQASPSGSPAVVSGSSKINIEANSEVHIHSNAVVRLAGPCTTYGAGPINVEGELRAEQPHTCQAPVNVVGGVHTVDTSQVHSYGSVTYDSNSNVNLLAGPQGFNTVQCSGAVNAAGQLNIRTNGYAPQGPVTLMQAGQLQGQFAACTSDSATIKGAVQHSGNAVTWFPDASQCSGGCVPVM